MIGYDWENCKKQAHLRSTLAPRLQSPAPPAKLAVVRGAHLSTEALKIALRSRAARLRLHHLLPREAKHW